MVNDTLQGIGASDKKTIMIFNKIDAFSFTPKDEDDLTPIKRENLSLQDLKRTWMNKNNNPCLFISATNKENIDALRTLIYDCVKELHMQRYPYNNFFYW